MDVIDAIQVHCTKQYKLLLHIQESGLHFGIMFRVSAEFVCATEAKHRNIFYRAPIRSDEKNIFIHGEIDLKPIEKGIRRKIFFKYIFSSKKKTEACKKYMSEYQPGNQTKGHRSVYRLLKLRTVNSRSRGYELGLQI